MCGEWKPHSTATEHSIFVPSSVLIILCLVAEVWFWCKPVLIVILELFKWTSKSCSNKGITAGWTVIFLVWLTCQKRKDNKTMKDEILWTHYLFRYYMDVAIISIHPLSITVYPTQGHGGGGFYASFQWVKVRLQLCEVVKSVWHIETNKKKTHTLTVTPEVNVKSPNLNVFGLRGEATQKSLEKKTPKPLQHYDALAIILPF